MSKMVLSVFAAIVVTVIWIFMDLVVKRDFDGSAYYGVFLGVLIGSYQMNYWNNLEGN